jgi:tetratricopeptide (TPR) repeat protein
MVRRATTHNLLGALSARYSSDVQLLHAMHIHGETLSASAVLQCLRTRDRIAILLANTPPSETTANHIVAADQLVGALSKALAHDPLLAEYYTSFPPRDNAWWWPKHEPRKTLWQKIWPFTGRVAAFLSAASVFFVFDVLLRRWYGEPPAFFTGISTALTTILAVLAWAGIQNPLDSSALRPIVDALPGSFRRPTPMLVVFGALLAVEILIFAISPQIADWQYDTAFTAQERGAVVEAQQSYERALRFKPDFALAHSQYGVLLENMDSLDQAKQQYGSAIAGQSSSHSTPDADLAFNNLGRLYLLEQRYDLAIQVLSDGIFVVNGSLPTPDPQDTAALTGTLIRLHSNLAWTRLEQAKRDQNPSRLDQALEEVARAKQLLPTAPDAFIGKALCVYAETMRMLNKSTEKDWRECLAAIEKEPRNNRSDPNFSPDADYWYGIARMNLPVP